MEFCWPSARDKTLPKEPHGNHGAAACWLSERDKTFPKKPHGNHGAAADEFWTVTVHPRVKDNAGHNDVFFVHTEESGRLMVVAPLAYILRRHGITCNSPTFGPAPHLPPPNIHVAANCTIAFCLVGPPLAYQNERSCMKRQLGALRCNSNSRRIVYALWMTDTEEREKEIFKKREQDLVVDWSDTWPREDIWTFLFFESALMTVLNQLHTVAARKLRDRLRATRHKRRSFIEEELRGFRSSLGDNLALQYDTVRAEQMQQIMYDRVTARWRHMLPFDTPVPTDKMTVQPKRKVRVRQVYPYYSTRSKKLRNVLTDFLGYEKTDFKGKPVRLLVLEGHPGSGKTFESMKAMKTANDWTFVPIWLQLGQCPSRHQANSYVDVVQEEFGFSKLQMQKLRRLDILFILDGLPENSRGPTQLLRHFPYSKMLVTTRPYNALRTALPLDVVGYQRHTLPDNYLPVERISTGSSLYKRLDNYVTDEFCRLANKKKDRTVGQWLRFAGVKAYASLGPTGGDQEKAPSSRTLVEALKSDAHKISWPGVFMLQGTVPVFVHRLIEEFFLARHLYYRLKNGRTFPRKLPGRDASQIFVAKLLHQAVQSDPDPCHMEQLEHIARTKYREQRQHQQMPSATALSLRTSLSEHEVFRLANDWFGFAGAVLLLPHEHRRAVLSKLTPTRRSRSVHSRASAKPLKGCVSRNSSFHKRRARSRSHRAQPKRVRSQSPSQVAQASPLPSVRRSRPSSPARPRHTQHSQLPQNSMPVGVVIPGPKDPRASTRRQPRQTPTASTPFAVRPTVKAVLPTYPALLPFAPSRSCRFFGSLPPQQQQRQHTNPVMGNACERKYLDRAASNSTSKYHNQHAPDSNEPGSKGPASIDFYKNGGFVYRGLRNRGNTCFMNSILQSLAGLSDFKQYLAKRTDAHALLSALFDVISPEREWQSHVSHHEPTKLEAFNPDKFHKLFGKACPSLADGAQHDAHQLYQALLTELDQKVRKEDQLLNPLSTEKTTTMTCQNKMCFHEFPTMHERCTSITVFPRAQMRSHTGTGLEAALRSWSRQDSLDGMECPKCSARKTMEDLKQQRKQEWDDWKQRGLQHRINVLEDLLAHPEQLVSDEEEFNDAITERVECTVALQERLRYAPQVLCALIDRKSSDQYMSFPMHLNIKEHVVPPDIAERKEMRLRREREVSAARRNVLDSTQYVLSAVVCHSGSHYGGHYFMFRRLTPLREASGKNPDTCAWVYMSDSYVRRESWDRVSRARAFMLFYEQV